MRNRSPANLKAQACFELARTKQEDQRRGRTEPSGGVGNIFKRHATLQTNARKFSSK
jgi:hypothetical protein